MVNPHSHDNLQDTLDYVPKAQTSLPQVAPTPSGASSAKIGVAQGEKLQLVDETAALLRSRLIAATLFMLAIMTLAMIPQLTTGNMPLIAFRTAILLIVVAGYMILRNNTHLSLSRVRAVEMMVFGALAIQAVIMPMQGILHAAKTDDAVMAAVVSCFMFSVWSMLILLYGFLIPNTWRRAAAILLPAAAIPLVTQIVLQSFFEKVDTLLYFPMFPLPPTLPFVAALAAVYGTKVIHLIREEAFKAKQFGQYRLKGKLGSGGMGEVYEAEHVLLKRRCAIKLIKPGSDTDADSLARFEQEVRTTARLTHWNVIEIFDYGHTYDGTFYYVMELLPSMTLEELIQTHGPLPPERAIHFLRQTCCALREAHGAGLIHRDIKPANILTAEQGGVYDVAKLLDFGLVKQREAAESDSRLTQPGALFGSPMYLSPEQATGASQADARSDIYSLGAVAYFLLTGQPPFKGRTPMEFVVAHARDEVKPPSTVRPDIPADLERIVMRCLAKNPEDRFADAQSLRESLGACESAGKWTDKKAAVWWQTVESQKPRSPDV